MLISLLADGAMWTPMHRFNLMFRHRNLYPLAGFVAHYLHFSCLMSWRTRPLITSATTVIFLVMPHIHCCFVSFLWPNLSHINLISSISTPCLSLSTCICVFFSLLLCSCPSLYSRPPNLPSYTLCLTHLLSARQVSVAKRQGMSDGLLLRERRLSIMISYLPVQYSHKLDYSCGSCSGPLCREINADFASAHE